MADLIRVLITEPDTNLAHLTIACPTHARDIVHRSGRQHRFVLSPARDTERPCDHCVAAHAKSTVADWPLGTDHELDEA